VVPPAFAASKDSLIAADNGASGSLIHCFREQPALKKATGVEVMGKSAGFHQMPALCKITLSGSSGRTIN
jgi:hypothetical protein